MKNFIALATYIGTSFRSRVNRFAQGSTTAHQICKIFDEVRFSPCIGIFVTQI